jgi:hypothetical protein
LKENGYYGTGTIRENRISKDIPFPNKKVASKMERGSTFSALDKNNGIQYVRWVANAVITMASTGYGVNPKNSVKRFSRQEKKLVQVPRPLVVSTYNNNMGGTDLMDENINRYRISIRGKKWWWCIYTWLIDVTVQNAWILYKTSHKKDKMSQLELRRIIVTNYLLKYQDLPKTKGRPTVVNSDKRYDGTQHYVVNVPDGKRRRCSYENCNGKGRTMCNKCDKGLCISCFVPFHT